ncbi:MAG: molybdenum cofactor guanylyltransferase [Synergistaceae bacterium]|nr:molybdenum cofactor guanylyltransferase [Synergistaceae bacterium]MDD3915669.1 molybdenum cofactor guanylyltransferase [Synergistaceae bacterium]NLD96468.1 molybdenum cofactor guanylyltransferase [Synergistaceae bacterium]
MSNFIEEFPGTTLILAGGQGSRMGGEKLTLAVDSEPLLLKVIRRVLPFSKDILLSVAPRQVSYVSTVLSGIISLYGIRTVEDRLPVEKSPSEVDEKRSGPLAGIVAGLEACSSEWLFVCACDMPRVSEAVVRTLWKHGDKSASVIVPFLGGFYEPLHAFYRKTCLPAATALLDSGRRKTTAFYDAVRVSPVGDEYFSHLPGYRRSFENLNNKSDLEKMTGFL